MAINEFIIQRIKEVMAVFHLNQKELSIATGVRPNNLSEMLSGKRPMNGNFLINLCSRFGINSKWLLGGEGNMLIDLNGQELEEGEELNPDLNAKISTRPRIPLTAAAGSLSGVPDGVTLNDCEQLPIIHQFPSYDFTMFIKGDSMSPRYESGDEIACRKIDQSRFIQWGKPHVLDTTQGIIVKRVYKDGNSIRCVSYNPNYTDFSIPKEDIYSMSLVVGSLNISEM